MKSKDLACLGLGACGASIGYMVGASGTPVVEYALPLIFGLAISGFAFFRPRATTANDLELLKLSEENEFAKEMIKNAHSSKSESMGLFGIALFVFSLTYLSGTFIGGVIRVNGLLEKERISFFPWSKDNVPQEAEKVISWIQFTKQLSELGYSQKQIVELYSASTSNTKQVFYPWNEESPPESVSIAVKWIKLSNQLTIAGYSEEQIENLYVLTKSKKAIKEGVTYNWDTNILNDWDLKLRDSSNNLGVTDLMSKCREEGKYYSITLGCISFENAYSPQPGYPLQWRDPEGPLRNTNNHSDNFIFDKYKH